MTLLLTQWHGLRSAAVLALASTTASAALAAPPGSTKPPVPACRADLAITKPFLLLPIDNDGRGVDVSLMADGREVRCVGATLAKSEEDADWWAFLHVAEYKGRTVTLRVEGRDLTEAQFELMRQDDKVPGEEKWGSEAKRPQFHFSQKVGWNNDPNGLVYLDGEWHLYFQHNPMGWPWGSMSWGHAVSRDLVNWEQLPVALHYEGGMGMWSGGAAVDWKNSGGWKRGANDVIFITWTTEINATWP